MTDIEKRAICREAVAAIEKLTSVIWYTTLPFTKERQMRLRLKGAINHINEAEHFIEDAENEDKRPADDKVQPGNSHDSKHSRECTAGTDAVSSPVH